MICTIHEDYKLASHVFEIAEPYPPVPVEKMVLYLIDVFKDYAEVTDIEPALLRVPFEESDTPKMADRIFVNINKSLITKYVDYEQIIVDAADTLFMTSIELE
jgi:hypothetical protein